MAQLDPNEVIIDISAAWRPGGKLGGYVGTGQSLVIDAIVVCPRHLKVFQGDTFRAAFEVGSGANEARYGANAGIQFTILDGRKKPNMFFGLSVPSGDLAYHARSEPQLIYCNDNRLDYSVPGESDDELIFRSYTAGMAANHLVVNQRDSAPDFVQLVFGAMQFGFSTAEEFDGDHQRRYFCTWQDPKPPEM
jgi:hypothetical protein